MKCCVPAAASQIISTDWSALTTCCPDRGAAQQASPAFGVARSASPKTPASAPAPTLFRSRMAVPQEW